MGPRPGAALQGATAPSDADRLLLARRPSAADRRAARAVGAVRHADVEPVLSDHLTAGLGLDLEPVVPEVVELVGRLRDALVVRRVPLPRLADDVVPVF